MKAFSSAFDVQLGHYGRANMTYRGRTGPVGLPKALEGIVVEVFGLDNRPFARPHFRTFKPRAGRRHNLPAFSADRRQPVRVSEGDGSGQTVGMIELGGGFQPANFEKYSLTSAWRTRRW